MFLEQENDEMNNINADHSQGPVMSLSEREWEALLKFAEGVAVDTEPLASPDTDFECQLSRESPYEPNI